MMRSTEASNEVTVLFEDAALSFVLPPGATLAELAERIAGMASHHRRYPLSIGIKLPH